MAAKRLSIAPLVWLQVRRLCLGFPGLLFVISLVVLRWSWGKPAGYGGLQDAPLNRLSDALQQGAWLCLLCFSLQIGLRIRALSRKEANWLAPLGLGQGAYVLAIWLGSCVAAGLAMVLLFLGLVGTDQTSAPQNSIDRVISWKTDASIAPGQALQHELPVGSSEQLAILVRPTLGTAPTTAASLTISKGTIGKQSEARIAGLRWLFVDIPDGPDPLHINLVNQGERSLGVLAERSLLTLSSQTAAGHWFALGLRAWLWLCLNLALVLGACTWLRPAIAIPMAWLVGLGLAPLGFAWLAAWPAALEWQRFAMGSTRLAASGALPAVTLLVLCWLLARRGLRAWGIDR